MKARTPAQTSEVSSTGSGSLLVGVMIHFTIALHEPDVMMASALYGGGS